MISDANRPLDDALGAWLQEGSTQLPDRSLVLGNVRAALPKTSQRRPTPWHPSGRFRSMFAATKLVVAGLVVAIVGIGLFASLTPGPKAGLPAIGAAATDAWPGATTSAPATAGPPTTPPVQAAARSIALSGTLETPIGRYEWQRISAEDLPSELRRYRSLMEWHGDTIAMRDGRNMWVTDDGSEWTGQRLPAAPRDDGDGVLYVDDVSWVVQAASRDRKGGHHQTGEPIAPSFWHSRDGVDWTELAPGAWTLPGPSGLDWRFVTTSAATADALVLVEDAAARFPIRRFIPNGCNGKTELRKRAGGTYAVRNVNADKGCTDDWTVLRFVRTENGLRVMDDKTDRRLGMLQGARLKDLEPLEGLGNARRIATRVHVVDESGLRTIDAPWAADGSELLADGGDAGGSLAAIDGAFYAYVQRPDGGIDTWTASDGVEWHELGPAGLPTPLATGFHVKSEPGRVLVNVEGDRSWATTDGTTWVDASAMPPADQPEATGLERIDSGWLAFEQDESDYRRPARDTLWLSVGGEWVSLAPLGFDCPDPERSTHSSWTALGDTTFILAYEGCESDTRSVSPDLWVLSPAS